MRQGFVAAAQVTAVKIAQVSGVWGIIPDGRAAILSAAVLSTATEGQFRALTRGFLCCPQSPYVHTADTQWKGTT